VHATPFLLFDGNCAEAMTFYQQALGGDLQMTKLGDSPLRDQLPPDKHERIINAHLVSGGVELSATDWMAAPAFEPLEGNMSAVFVQGSDERELRAVFDKLAVGANREHFQELHDLPIGKYGQFYDRFGKQWIFLVARH